MMCASCGVVIEEPSFCRTCYEKLMQGKPTEPRNIDWYATMYMVAVPRGGKNG